jgi:mono/diheme cytochrome c family protein
MRFSRNMLIVAASVLLPGTIALNASRTVDRGPWNPGPSAVQTAARWTIPATAVEEKNPLTVNAAVLAGGKKLYDTKCQSCHGPAGKGDGPDADKKYADTMDLTQPSRAARNADGQVFYKIWNGRLNPKMPAFSEQMTKEQAWAVVAYVQSLRQK